MNDKLQEIIIQYCEENKSEFLKYKQEDPTKDVLSYLTLVVDGGNTLENSLLMSNLADRVFDFLAPDLGNFIVDLGSHRTDYNNKSLDEIAKDENINYNLTPKIIRYYSDSYIKMSALNYLFFDKKPNFITLIDDRYLTTETDIKCSHCDQCLYVLIDCIDKKVIFKNKKRAEDCSSFPSSITLDFHVPSKKIVLVNDSRYLIEAERDDEYKYSVCSSYGRIRECEAYIEKGTPYFSLGSSIASVVNKDGVIHVNTDYMEDAIENLSLSLWGLFLWDYEMFQTHYEQKLLEEKDEDDDDGDLDDILGEKCVIELTSDKIQVEFDAINSTVKITEK